MPISKYEDSFNDGSSEEILKITEIMFKNCVTEFYERVIGAAMRNRIG